GRGVGVEHRGVVHVLPLAGECGFDGELLHVDVRADQRRELGRQGADTRGLYAVAVDEAGHLDRAARRKVVDQLRVWHVAVDHARLAGLDAAYDRRRVLEARPYLDRPAALEPGALRFPSFDLGDAAPRVLVEGDVEAFDEIR